MSVSITNLSKNYGNQAILKNISFTIGDGEVVGFLGPNGAGKTTTMRIIAGVLGYQSGSVEVCGFEVSENSLRCNALVGYLPEQNPLYAEMYVTEYLQFAAESHGIRHNYELVNELIDKVGLRPELHKKIGQLSKGYRQRVGLAQALIPNPKVLLLDEPTTGLDPNQLEEIRNLIRELGKDRTVILSTHIMQEIKAICNRVLIINAGEIVADFPDINSISVFDENSLHFEVAFLNETEICGIETITNITATNKKRFNIEATTDIREDLFDFAVKTKNKILIIKPVERSMEEVFRNLTK